MFTSNEGRVVCSTVVVLGPFDIVVDWVLVIVEVLWSLVGVDSSNLVVILLAMLDKVVD